MCGVNVSSTREFLALFGDNFWLQTFDDTKKDRSLVSDWFIKLEENFNFIPLIKLNESNAGVYFCVNELRHMHKKRNADNVENIRAFFVDLDGAPLKPVMECGLLPNIVVCSSVGRWHAYWIMDDIVKADRKMFKELQRAIAKRFKGDESVSDLCRVMRLPGFYNMKKEKFLVTYEVHNEKPYNIEEIKNEFGTERHNQLNNSGDGGDLLPKPDPANIAALAGWATPPALQALLKEDAARNHRLVGTIIDGELSFDANRLRGAMLGLDSGVYDTWIKVGMALQGAARRPDAELSEDEAYEYWITWSELSNKFDSKAAEQKWQGLEARGELGLGTIFLMATEGGWTGGHRLTWQDPIAELNRIVMKNKFGT